MENSQSPTKTKKKNKYWILGIIMFIASIAIICGIIFWFLSQNQTTTSGQFADPESSNSISCTGENIDYPYFEVKNTSKTSIKVDATFSSNKLNAISMYYSLYYNSGTDLAKAKANNLAKINLASQNEDLGSYIFDLDIKESNDHLEAHFFTNAKEITPKSAGYLLLSAPSDSQGTYTKDTIINNYQSLGLKCAK